MKKRLSSCQQIIKTLFLLLMLISVSENPLHAQSTEKGITTIILVRHAEKLDDDSDPGLSEAGYKRAAKLAEIFDHVEFDAVYSTDFNRTRETAQPVAEANELSITLYEPHDPKGEIEKWLENHWGETILISGHSNTTPAFTNAILEREHYDSDFDESDYGNLLIITISGNGEKELLHLRY